MRFSIFKTGLTLSLFVITFFLSACSDDRQSQPSEALSETLDDTALEHGLKHKDPTYVCPMHSQIVRGEPGSCPICGMDLVLTEVDDGGDEGMPVVKLSAAVVQNMGVRTAYVNRGSLWRYIRTPGRVEFDETRISHVHPRAEGWVEKLGLRAEGDPVKKGQTLLQLYSPDILAAQVDFLIALDNKSGRKGSSEKARNRLRLLDVPESVIKKIEKTRTTLNRTPMLAPRAGVLSKLNIREGMYVKPNTEILAIADLSKVWVQVDIYEHQLAWVERGQSAEVRVPAYPGRVWEGKVEYLYPEVDKANRTLKVRLSFDNPDALLRPNMLAEVVIYGGPRHNTLKIPRDALIATGTRQTVIKALGEGKFQPIDVSVGMQQNDQVEILSGLAEGDEVVVSGQFLIDSESSLQASFRRMGN